jgi:hypothetical protein
VLNCKTVASDKRIAVLQIAITHDLGIVCKVVTAPGEYEVPIGSGRRSHTADLCPAIVFHHEVPLCLLQIHDAVAEFIE